MKRLFIACTVILSLVFFHSAALAGPIAVVDTNSIFFYFFYR